MERRGVKSDFGTKGNNRKNVSRRDAYVVVSEGAKWGYKVGDSEFEVLDAGDVLKKVGC